MNALLRPFSRINQMKQQSLSGTLSGTRGAMNLIPLLARVYGCAFRILLARSFVNMLAASVHYCLIGMQPSARLSELRNSGRSQRCRVSGPLTDWRQSHLSGSIVVNAEQLTRRLNVFEVCGRTCEATALRVVISLVVPLPCIKHSPAIGRAHVTTEVI
jgi:hypothetical protein